MNVVRYCLTDRERYVMASKSELIRQVARENPQLVGKPTAIANLVMSQHSVTKVTPALVNQALGKKAGEAVAAPKATKAPKAAAAKSVSKPAAAQVKPVKGVAPRPAKARLSASVASAVSAADVVVTAKQLLTQAGGVNEAKKILDAIAD